LIIDSLTIACVCGGGGVLCGCGEPVACRRSESRQRKQPRAPLSAAPRPPGWGAGLPSRLSAALHPWHAPVAYERVGAEAVVEGVEGLHPQADRHGAVKVALGHWW
jgi:hypothetical protein